jgi:hypothetical protein
MILFWFVSLSVENGQTLWITKIRYIAILHDTNIYVKCLSIPNPCTLPGWNTSMVAFI